jgi:uncharacterized protein (DUF2384 family)
MRVQLDPKVYEKALDVLESRAVADRWLHTPKLALFGRRPIDADPAEVIALLHKIEHGIYT